MHGLEKKETPTRITTLNDKDMQIIRNNRS